MRILVFEYITGGGLAGAPLPAALAVEGELMARALVDDLAALPGVELLVPRDPRIPSDGLPGRVLRAQGPLAGQWPRWVDEADAVWLVAPESGGVLEALTGVVESRGRVLLGCRSDAVRVAASKQQTAFRLGARGLPVVPTAPAQAPLTGEGPWVVKPDDGVGCSDTRLFHRPSALAHWLKRRAGFWVVQPWLAGTPASLSLLCREGSARLLAVNRQRVSLQCGRFRLEGLEVNALAQLPGPWELLAAGVARALPGLWGYVGVDLMLTAEGPRILEVNPRLTSSYAGLSRSLGRNVAAQVLALAAGAPLPEAASAGGPVALDFEVPHVA